MERLRREGEVIGRRVREISDKHTGVRVNRGRGWGCTTGEGRGARGLNKMGATDMKIQGEDEKRSWHWSGWRTTRLMMNKIQWRRGGIMLWSGNTKSSLRSKGEGKRRREGHGGQCDVTSSHVASAPGDNLSSWRAFLTACERCVELSFPQYQFGSFAECRMRVRVPTSEVFVVFSVLIVSLQIGCVSSTGDKIPLGKWR